MTKYATRRLNRMGRRRFLRTLATIGVSGAALRYMTKDALAQVTDNPKEEVPRLSRLRHKNHEEVTAGTAPPEYEPVYYTIPRDQWAEVEAVNDAAQRIDRTLSTVTDSDLLSVGVRGIKQSGDTQRGINIRYGVQVDGDGEVIRSPGIDLEAVRSRVPTEAVGTAGEGEHAVTRDDIPVEVNRYEIELLNHSDPSGGAGGSSYYYDYSYRPLPGGALISNETNGEAGTSTAPAYDNQHSKYVLTTTAHFCDGQSGHTVSQPCCNYNVGNTEKAEFRHWDMDAATIALGSNGTKSSLAADGQNQYEIGDIWGTVRWDEIVDNVNSSSYDFQWQGITSGHLPDNQIVEYNTDRYLWVENPGSGGDSGGPIYKVEFSGFNPRYYIAGLVAQVDDGDNDGDADTAGPWMGAVENEFNLNV